MGWFCDIKDRNIVNISNIPSNNNNNPTNQSPPNTSNSLHTSNSPNTSNSLNTSNTPNTSNSLNISNTPNVPIIPICIGNQNVQPVNNEQPVALNAEELLAHVPEPKHNSMECHVCNELYGPEPDNIPKLLHCGHTVCNGCTVRFGKHSHVPNSLKCPFCIKWSKYGKIEEFPINAAILNVLERRQGKKRFSWCRNTKKDRTKILPKCKKCNQEFTPFDGERAPWANLKCGHTTCERCLKSMYDTKSRVIKCSECPHKYNLNRCATWDYILQEEEWQSEFTKNYAIADIVQFT